MEIIFNVIAIIEDGVVSYGAKLPIEGFDPGAPPLQFLLTAHL